jgi:SAM-dependent methyltransferase
VIQTKCAICNTLGNSSLLYEATFNKASFSAEVFSARRLPDRKHYAWVRCNSCELLRSDPISNANLGDLYEKSTFDYGGEIIGLTKTYREGFLNALNGRARTGAVLEVGGGNSFFLEEVIRLGFNDVNGIEPSIDAVEKTRADIRPRVKIGLMGPGSFANETFDVVTMFHVMDHLPEPLETIQSCLKALKSSGILLVAVHDERSWSSRIFKSKSPIFDIEHTYLFSKKTAVKIFKKAGYVDVRAWSYSNHYSLAYLIQLTPLPDTLKKNLLTGKTKHLLSKVQIKVPLGNIFVLGIKP